MSLYFAQPQTNAAASRASGTVCAPNTQEGIAAGCGQKS